MTVLKNVDIGRAASQDFVKPHRFFRDLSSVILKFSIRVMLSSPECVFLKFTPSKPLYDVL